MKKYILTLALILMMLSIAFLKGYGEERSMRAAHNTQVSESSLDTTLGDLNF